MQEIIKYQEIDSRLRKLEAELQSSENRKNAADMQRYLKDGQARLMKLDQISKSLLEQYQKAVSLYNDFVNKLSSLSKKVADAKDNVNDELANTLDNFKATSENLDNNIVNLSNKINSVNREFEGIMNNAKKAKRNLDIYKAGYAKEREKLEPEINKLKSELNAQKSKVNPALLTKYNSKSEGKVFPIFVAEVGGRCGGCRMEISAGKLSDLKTKGTIECENCGRVIYTK